MLRNVSSSVPMKIFEVLMKEKGMISISAYVAFTLNIVVIGHKDQFFVLLQVEIIDLIQCFYRTLYYILSWKMDLLQVTEPKF
jgi:hypothetical protein